jgi:hypothetical protein
MFDQDTEIKIAAITEESSNFLSQASSKNSASTNGSDGILPPLMSNPNSGGDDALEQAAKSLQKLYVNPVIPFIYFYCFPILRMFCYPGFDSAKWTKSSIHPAFISVYTT